jgi:hypothetical protein
MTGKIYQKESRLVIWLGNTPDGVQAFSLLEDLCERVEAVPEADDTPALLQSAINAYEKCRPQRFAFLERFDPRFAALARLLKHDYFSRAWIIQDIVFGERVHVRCGGSWIDWAKFSYPIKLLSHPEYYTLIGPEELYKHLEEPTGGGANQHHFDSQRTETLSANE